MPSCARQLRLCNRQMRPAVDTREATARRRRRAHLRAVRTGVHGPEGGGERPRWAWPEVVLGALERVEDLDAEEHRLPELVEAARVGGRDLVRVRVRVRVRARVRVS